MACPENYVRMIAQRPGWAAFAGRLRLASLHLMVFVFKRLRVAGLKQRRDRECDSVLVAMEGYGSAPMATELSIQPIQERLT